ncbi:MAG: WxL domain-containing protein [Chloroflexi bacterium]|nr:WxL domain-containing protein [Chloroflexota bacterium]
MTTGPIVPVVATLAAGVALFAFLRPALAVRGASVADLVLGDINYSHTAQQSHGTLVLTASDDAPDGWNVTILASAFVYSGTNGGTDIPAANFALTSAGAPAATAGQAIDAAGGPRVPAASPVGSLDTARKTIQADAGFGQGTYTQALGVTLTIPARSRAGTYTGTLTTTIAAGP